MSSTIYALTTPLGKSGVAVVRVSGSAAKESLAALTGITEPEPRYAYFKKITHPETKAAIDEALVIYFKAPASFTGEDVVEYHLHGSIAVINSLLAVLQTQKQHRHAEAGEFTRRAFDNGKIDLTAAEAIADLIDAETEAQRAQAFEQVSGGLRSLYEGWAERLTKALAYIEANIDFVEEDDAVGALHKALPPLSDIAAAIQEHLKDARRGERLRHGLQVAVVGAANSGKSTLVNTLARRDVAIVSATAGTTRDILEVHLDIGGYPVILLDTAGLRPEDMLQDAQGQIEAEGIRRTRERATSADIKILMFDAAQLPALDPETMRLQDENSLLVLGRSKAASGSIPENLIITDAASGEGLQNLLQQLEAKIKTVLGTKTASPPPTRTRYKEALQECLAALGRAKTQAERGEQGDPALFAEDMRLAVRSIGRITGRVDVEDLLDIIFRDFCIGK